MAILITKPLSKQSFNLMCPERNIPYIDHTNSIQPGNHLNESKSHLNRYGTIAFANSMSTFLSEYY